MSVRGGSITIDIKTQISNLREVLAQMQKEVEKLDVGSALGKSLRKEISDAQKQLEALGKDTNIRIGSDSGIDNLTNKLTNVSTKVKDIGADMQNVKFDDFSTQALENAIKDLQKDWETTKQQFEEKINIGLEEEIQKAPALSKYLEKIGVDLENINRESVEKALEENLNKTEEAAKNAADHLAEVQQQYQDIKQQVSEMSDSDSFYSRLKDSLTALEGTDFSIKKVMNPQALQSLIDDWEKQIDGLNQYTDSQKQNFKAIIQNYFNPAGGFVDSKDLNRAIQSFKEQFGDLFSTIGGEDKTSFINKVFGTDKFFTPEDIKNLFHLDPNAIETGKQAINNILSKFKPDELGGKGKQIFRFLSNNEIEKAAQATIALLQEKFREVEAEYNRLRQEQLDKKSELRSAALEKGRTAQAETTARERLLDYEDRIKDLEAKNQDYLNRLTALEEQIKAGKNGAIDQFKNTGRSGETTGNNEINEAIKNATLYKSELDQVKDKEKLIGKIEGVVQRWFSIYAAVRMVSNAIKSVISTVKELDQTITEIAIVTDMTQDDLWKQMSDYTDMATQYAASISGVYKVSQLYYQQGLQTADVMALTEETLKMARISGLDYAEATNYMTNAVRSFKMEMTDAQRVVDVYSAIAASSATSTAELASAMSKTASSAQAVGSSFENTTAMMAVMIEATRESAENIGSALKSIISRYGEMKDDPAKLIDSEGEEMSLNKVDKALKSVGISLQDTNHQFRNFDDVITELAGKWDTIDTNTQRYIATIMAGNRQQSRFLALVSSGDRLTELSEKAADSQNEATLQMLKTMDSIEAKSQQLKTSLQSLYTSSGVQNLFKGILDLGNNIIQTFTKMPTTFNLPILAIVRFGTQFYALANIVTTVFTLIRNKLSTTAAILAAEERSKTQQSVNERVSEEELGAQKTVSIWKAMANEFKAIQAEMTGDVQKAADIRAKINGNSAKGANKSLVKGGLLANVAGGALTLASASIKGDSEAQLRGKGALEGVGALLQGIGTGAMMGGGIPGAIVGALTALPGIISGIATAHENAAEKAERLKKAVEDTNNAYLQRHDELKTLQEQADKFEELAKAQYDSKEAKEAFLAASNEIAEQHPELISAIDSEGNAIVDLGNKYLFLEKARKAAIEAAQETAVASYEEADSASNEARKQADTKIQDYLNNAGSIFTSANLQNSGQQSLKDILGNALIGTGKSLSEADLLTLGDASSTFSSFSASGFLYNLEEKNLIDLNQLSSEALEALGDYIGAFEGKISEINEQISQGAQFESNDDTVQKAIDAILDKDDKALKSILLNDDYTINTENINALKEAREKAESDFEKNLIDNLLELAAGIGGSSKDAAEASDVKDAVIRSGIAKVAGDSLIGLDEDYLKEMSNASQFLNEMVAQSYTGSSKKDYEAFLKEVPNKVAIYNEQLSTIWKNMTPNDQANFNNLIANSGYYNKDNFKEVLSKYLKEDEELTNAIIENLYNKVYSISDFTQAVQNLDTDFDISQYSDILGQLGSQDLLYILDIYKNVDKQIQNKTISADRGNDLIAAYMNLYATTSKFGEDAVEANKLISGMSDFSLDGIAKFKDSVNNSGLSKENIESLNNAADGLKNLIPVNLNTEINTFISSVTEGMGDFESALSKATKGMSYKDAAEIAAKMGTTVSSFKQVGTKFFIDDLNALKDAYIKVDKELLTVIDGEINSVGQALKNVLPETLRTGEITISSSGFNSEAQLAAITKALENQNVNIDAGQLQLAEKYEEWLAIPEETRQDFVDYVIESLKLDIEEAKKVEEFVNIQIAENYLANGDFSNFLNNLNLKENQRNEYQKYFDEGNFDQLLEIFPQYADTIIKTFKDIGTGLLNRITSESSYDNYVSVDSTNASSVQQLVDAGLASYIYDSNGEITGAKLVELTEENIDEFNNAIDNLPLTPSEKAKSAADATKSLYENSLDKIVDDIAKNSKSVSAETAELMRQQLITAFGEESGNEKFDQLFKDSGNGTYEANINDLQDILRYLWWTLSDKTRQAAKVAVQKTADDLIKEISTATSLLTKGTDSNSDKQTFVDRFKELTGKTISIDTAFNYNELLGTDTLDYSIYQEYLQADARALGEAKGLVDEELDNFIEEYLARQGKNLAKEVDIKSFLSAEKKDEGSKAYQTLVSQMKNFYASTEKTEEEAQEEISKSIGNIVQGGQVAVDELLAWAEKSGEEVSEEDVATIYRYGMDDIENAFEQLSYNVGSIVSGQAKEIIQGLTDAGWELEEIEGTDSAVIKAVGDVADAYLAYYNKLVTSEKATVAALNGAMAKVLETREDSNIIDALGDAASMTYSQLGEILATKGKKLTEDFVKQYSDAIQSIGGGKVRITNFDKFATEIMGWTDIDKNSEEYISAFKTYNDSLVDMNRKAERNIIEEVQALENAKGGDWINLTQLYSELTKDLVPDGYKGNVDLKHRPIVDFGEYYETILGTSRMDSDFSEIEGELPKIGITLASITKDGIELTEEYIDNYSVKLFDKAKDIQASGDTRKLSEIIKEVDASMDNLLLDAIDGYGETAEELGQTLNSNAEELHNRQAEWYGMLRALNNVGATIEDGILKIDEENANIPAIMSILINNIQNSGKLATQEEAQLLDTLNDNLKQYSDLISNGIKGNLNYQGAQKLEDWAKSSGIGSLDFQKTANGLKLSEQSAFKLYTILKDVDILQSSLTLEDLADSLKETSENYKDIPSIMSRIAELEREINNPKVSTARREEYQRELSVAKEIVQTRSMTDKGNFNFMKNDLPDSIKNVKDFWQGTYDGFSSMNKAIDKGYMSIDDFYNLANFMSDTAKITGKSVSFFGTEVGGSLDSLSSLLQKGFGAINNIDTEGPMVNLKAFGANFKTGASEMKKDYITGVKEMAKGQIKVLDAMIAQLELVVAMEKLKPVDINNDNKISLDELFILKTDDNGNIIGIDGLTKQGKDALQAILDASETNKDLANALDTFEINGKSMREWMEAAINGEIDSVEDAKVFQATLSAFYAALQTGDWSPESIKTNIIKFLQESLDEGTWAEFTLTDGTKVQVSHDGYIEEKDGKWYSNGNGKSYDTVEEARDAVRFEAETGIKNAFRNENGEMEGSIDIDDEYKVTVTEGINGEYKYSYKGASGETSGTKEEAIQAAYQDYHDQAIKNNDLPGANKDLEQWMIDHDIVTKFNLTITDVQATTNKTVGELSDEMLAALGIDVGLVTAVQAGIERAFSESSGAIGETITAAIITALSKVSFIGKDFTIPEIPAKVDKINIDTAKATPIFGPITKETGDKAKAFVESKQSSLNIPNLNAKVYKVTYSTPTTIDSKAIVASAKVTGQDINAGLAEGMSDTTTIAEKASEVGTSAVNAINDAAGTHSPSTITTQTGKDLVEGLVNGLNDSSSAVNAATTVASQIINAIQTYFNEHPITINTSVGSSSSGEGPDASGFETVQTAISNLGTNATTVFNNIIAKVQNLQTEQDKIKADKITAIQTEQDKIKSDKVTAIQTEQDKIKADKVTNIQVEQDKIKSNKVTAIQTEQDKIKSNKVTAIQTAQNAIRNDKVMAIQSAQSAIKHDKVSAIQTAQDAIKHDKVNDIQSAQNSISHDKIDAVRRALDNIGGTASFDVNISVNVSGGSNAKGTIGSWRVSRGGGRRTNGDKTLNWSQSYAYAAGKDTLMGELGPELVVSHGKYFLVGQSGPEMVKLDDDAIVFNHLQTEKLMKKGQVNSHGKPVTNEKNATSMAGGNFTGPALASASETLALLKELREMWKSLLNASAKQLGSEAGKNTGSSKSGSTPHSTDTADKSDKVSIKANIKEIQRWYNLLRQIENLEEKITYQEKLRDKLNSDRKSNGKAVYESYKKELDLLDKQISASKELATLQKKRYNDRKQDLENSWYGKMLYTYDDDGLQQYRSGNNRGLDLLTKITQTDSNGAPTGAAKNAQSQLAYLQKQGLNLNDLLVKGDGTKIAARADDQGNLYNDLGEKLTGQDLQTAREEMMQVFWDNVDGWRDEMDNLYDSYHDQEEAVLEEEKKRNEIMQAFVDNQLSLEQTILQAVEDMKQNEIDKLQDERDAYEEAVTNFIDGLNESLSKERSMYESEQNSNELEKMQRQLALLQRTGGSGAQVRSLQEQIGTKQQDIYFDERQSEIDAIQTASDNEIAKLDQQIDIMSQTLEYQKEHGLLWDQVYDVMGRSEAEIKDFVLKNGSEWASKSSLQIDEDLRALSSTVEMYVARREDAEKGKDPLNDKDPKAKKDWTQESPTGQKKKATGSPDGDSFEIETPKKPTKVSGIVDEGEKIDLDLSSELVEGELLDLPTKTPKPVKKPTKQPVKKPTTQPIFTATGLIGGKTMDLETLKKLIASGKFTSGKGFKNILSFKKGGIVDFTGPAWLDGTKTKPETVLNAEQTKALREQLISNKKAHEAMVDSAEISKNNVSNAANYNTNDSSITIENIDFDMNVSKIANDMDAKAAGEKALDEMVRIARKSGNRSLARR